MDRCSGLRAAGRCAAGAGGCGSCWLAADVGDGVSAQSGSASRRGAAAEPARRGVACQAAGCRTSQVTELMRVVAEEEEFVSSHACHF